MKQLKIRWIFYPFICILGLIMIYIKQQTYILQKQKSKLQYQNQSLEKKNNILLLEHTFLHNSQRMEILLQQLQNFTYPHNQLFI